MATQKKFKTKKLKKKKKLTIKRKPIVSDIDGSKQKFGSGRKKGVKNRFTTLKQAFFDVYHDVGGIDGMVKWVNDDPDNKKVFYQMISKMLPREVALSGTVEEDIKKVKVEIIRGNTKT